MRDYGADTMRVYEMFIGDFEKAAPWSQSSIKGSKRFLDKVWALSDKLTEGDSYRAELEPAFHRTVKKVTEDIEGLKMNTAIAALMSLLNDIQGFGSINRAEFKTYLILLNPFAPHMTEEIWEILQYGGMTEELWQQAGFEGMLNEAEWPKYDEAKCADSTVEIAVQVNGKIKARINVAADISAPDAIAAAKADGAVMAAIEGKSIIKELYVPKKLVNIVVK